MFQVGAYQVIKGWELMIADMQEGETRIVVLPSAVAYGTRGAGQQILRFPFILSRLHRIHVEFQRLIPILHPAQLNLRRRIQLPL